MTDGPVCYFCGSSTIKRGWADVGADHGRLELYCDNPRCDAREMTVLVRRDGVAAGKRADARVLDWLDRGGMGDVGMTGDLVTRIPGKGTPEEVLARRLSTDIVSVDVP